MRALSFLLPAVLLTFCVSALQASTIHVPADQPTIQAGIDAAVDGDTVLVADGIYTGSGNRGIDFGGKAIVVMSENGPENCVIDCEGVGRGFNFASGEDSNSVVQGFTITNGVVVYHGGGIRCFESSPAIIGNTITGNMAYSYGGGIYCSNSSPTITDNTISGNIADYGGGIYFQSSSPTITSNTISGNTGFLGGGIHFQASSLTITNSILWGDSPNEIGGGSPIVTYSNVEGGWPGGAIVKCCV